MLAQTGVDAASPPALGERSRAIASMPAAIVATSRARKPAKMHRAATCAQRSHLRGRPVHAALVVVHGQGNVTAAALLPATVYWIPSQFPHNGSNRVSGANSKDVAK